MKKVGIITFHNSYNCGSMLESYAMQKIIQKGKLQAEIINYSSPGQLALYNSRYKNNNLKNIIKNILIMPHINKIKENNNKYIEFQNKWFNLSAFTTNAEELDDSQYKTIISGSDQIWNITIEDFNDAYFLNWVKQAKKVAYAPSFGSKNIMKYSNNPEKYKNYISAYDALSIRENNGQKWLKDLTGLNVPVLLDPTLLLERNDYDNLIAEDVEIKEKFLFFYSPGFDPKMCEFVQKVAAKYKLKVITWSTKQYFIKNIKKYGFELPIYENPEIYLYLIKNAELVFTTSYHGTIFSVIYNKKFYTLKNGGMYGDDDRVITLLQQLDIMDHLIQYEFDDNFNYLKETDSNNTQIKLSELRYKSINYLKDNIDGFEYEIRE